MHVPRSFALTAALALCGAAPPLAGTFALTGAAPDTTATLAASPRAALTERLDIVFRRRDGALVRRYDVDMTKRLHLIIVGDDFRTFLHVHPVLEADGHFRLTQTFPRPALYHLYADATPHGLGHNVVRFDLSVAGGGPAAVRDLAPTGPRVTAGPYVVTLDRVRLRANGETRVVVHVTKDGAPAHDLHPYLGARAHAVFLDGRTLAYAHVHPAALGAAMPGMAMGGMAGMGGMTMPDMPPGATVDPAMVLHVDVAEAGTYKLWLQFRGGGRLYVAPFVLRAG